jgi:hypothetical protein
MQECPRAIGAKRTFKRADQRVSAFRRQIAVTALAIGSELQHVNSSIYPTPSLLTDKCRATARDLGVRTCARWHRLTLAVADQNIKQAPSGQREDDSKRALRQQPYNKEKQHGKPCQKKQPPGYGTWKPATPGQDAVRETNSAYRRPSAWCLISLKLALAVPKQVRAEP